MAFNTSWWDGYPWMGIAVFHLVIKYEWHLIQRALIVKIFMHPEVNLVLFNFYRPAIQDAWMTLFIRNLDVEEMTLYCKDINPRW